MTPERRNSGDRRKRPTPPLSRYTFVGRRRTRRRDIDSSPYYVDRLGLPLLLVLLTIFLFQILDAVLTLAHLRQGGVELNPAMNFLLTRGEEWFLGVKLGVSALGLLFLGVHKNFPMVRTGLTVIFLIFFGLVAYHCILALQRV
jgi:hypothetical protein